MSDYEPPRCCRVQMRKARKDHKCCECRGIITKGETYEYFSGVWDDPASYKTCSDCAEVRKQYDMLVANGVQDEFAPFELLAQYVFDSENLAMMQRMVDIKTKRGKTVPQWWMDRIAEGVK